LTWWRTWIILCHFLW